MRVTLTHATQCDVLSRRSGHLDSAVCVGLNFSAWDGRKGGIVVLMATDDIVIDGRFGPVSFSVTQNLSHTAEAVYGLAIN